MLINNDSMVESWNISAPLRPKERGFSFFTICLAGHRGAIFGLILVFLFIAIAYRKAHGIWSIASGLILALVLGFVVNYFFTTKA